MIFVLTAFVYFLEGVPLTTHDSYHSNGCVVLDHSKSALLKPRYA